MILWLPNGFQPYVTDAESMGDVEDVTELGRALETALEGITALNAGRVAESSPQGALL